MRVNKGIIFSVFLLVFIIGFLVFVIAETGLGIWTTDSEGNLKVDFAPEEIVYISGSGFSAASESNPVQLQVTRPNGDVHICPDSTWCSTSLPTTSSFSNYPYQLDGIEGTYTIDASDGVNKIQQTFTDSYYYACSQSCSSSSNCVGFQVGSYWYYPSSSSGWCGNYNFPGGCDTCDKRCKYDRKICADSDAEDNVPVIGDVVRTASATCDQDSDCSCPVDGCVGTTYYDYPTKGDCSSYGCSCNVETGSGEPCHYISHTHNDPRCAAPVCGDGSVNQQSEQCELPNTNDNSYCTQSTQGECSGAKLGIRDSKGNCNSDCGCVPDSFTYQCVKDQCGASCAVDADCPSGQCNLETCECKPLTAQCSQDSDCNDGKPCTTDICNEQFQCVHGNVPAETSCSDGLFCNGAEICDDSGVCLPGASIDCSELNGQCQAGVCNEDTDQCAADYSNFPLSTPCNDGLFCSETDHCDGNGNCVQLTAKNCDDSDACTLDSCDEEKQCVHTFNDAQGPVTSDLTGEQNPGDCTINIEANVADSCSNIVAAEYFINKVSCPDNTVRGTAMAASDGSFNSALETVIANDINVIDGRRSIFVRGEDAAGNWGVCVQINLDVDCIPPDTPTCNVFGGGNFGANLLGIDGTCTPSEKLICGRNVSISANVCDSESRIQAAEYFLDQDCNDPYQCLDWQGIPMTASDGSYDQKCENVNATVDTSLLSDGTHTIQLHGKDGAENWGKFILTPIASFIRDTTPPKTDKTLNPIDNKKITCYGNEATDANVAEKGALTDGCFYVKAGTTITLSANDFNPDNQANGGYNKLAGEYADKVKIHWIVWYKNNPGDAWTTDQSGEGNENADVTIALNKDSYHLIEYWAVDGCDYEEAHHFELDIVDTKAPTFTKTVGEPKVIGTGGYDYYVTQDTQICLSATDQQPHPVGDVSISCDVKQWDTNPSGEPDKEYSLQLLEGCFKYGEDSYHELTCTATDGLGNAATLTEKDIVDSQPPEIAKTIDGPSIGNCPLSTDGEKRPTSETAPCYIDGVTNIDVTATDQQPHPVDQVTCDWSYTVDGGDPIIGGTGLASPFVVHFPQESSHLLTITCRDALGNSVTDYETFLVDKTPPVTTKSYGTPFVSNDVNDWITSDTPISLTVDDAGPHKSGIKNTFYRVTLLGSDDACLSDSECQETTGSGEWATYNTNPFTIDEDSCHLIEFYSVDNVNKEETHKKQCVFVDNQPPESSKVVGIPKYPGKDNFDYYVTTDTPIDFTCVDAQPHPVDNSKFCFQVSQNQLGDLTSKYCESYEGNPEIGNEATYCCVNPDEQGKFQFNFLEESLHTIKWYCKDALGNEEETNIESDNVDDTPPVIIIWNPTLEEASDVKKCSQSIVVQIFDEKSGVKDSTVYAQLYDGEGNSVPDHMVPLTKSGSYTYIGLMDKQLPAGNYVLKVFATDNVGNEQIATRNEVLKEGIFVEYITPTSCQISPTDGGNCEFTYHLCMRGGSNIQFWMNKLGEIIPPEMMDATITSDDSSADVGLQQTGLTEQECEMIPTNQWDNGVCREEAGILPLVTECQEINGRTEFTLNLDLNTDVTQAIGPGVHDLKYHIESSGCTPDLG